MNSNPTRNLWLSVALAIFGMLLCYSWYNGKKAEYDKKYGTIKRVIVVSRDVLEMSTVDDTMLQTEEMPADFIQPGAIEDPQEAVGLVAAVPFKKGEQLLSNKLLTPGPNTGLSLQIPPFKRAVTIPVDEVRGVARLVRPGDHIDILTSVEIGRPPNTRREVKTLLQNVPVLATGEYVTNNIPRKIEVDSGGKAFARKLSGDTSFSSITIEASVKDAQNLIYLLSTTPGSIFLTLRNPNDNEQVSLATTSVDALMGLPTAAVLPEAPRVPAMTLPPPMPVQRQPLPVKKKSPFIQVR